jgi:cytidine deaminase
MSASIDHDELIASARQHVETSYAPFSKFKAGAVARSAAGNDFGGVIVENVSLGLAMCAERVAMFAAVTAGERPVALALAAPDTDGAMTWPCGACLQVALELGGRDLVVVVGDDDSGPTQSATIGELMPRGPKVDLRPN